jgi:hypothetical protein
MKFNPIVILLAGSSAFASTVSAQAPASVSEGEAPVVTEGQPTVAPSNLFLAEQFHAEQSRPQPPPPAAVIQSDVNNLRATEGRYRAEVKLLAENERQFVHCKLKNGKVLTGRLSDAGDVRFAVRTNALGDGASVEYKDLAESPRVVPAVGTRIKQGAQMAGFVAFVIVFFIPLALAGVIPSC